ANVGLENQADPRSTLTRGVHRTLDDRHHLVPLPLDTGEHRVGRVRQARLPDHPDRPRDGLTHSGVLLSGKGWTDTECDNHAVLLYPAGSFWTHEPTVAVRSDRPRGRAVGGAYRTVGDHGRGHRDHAGTADHPVSCG